MRRLCHSMTARMNVRSWGFRQLHRRVVSTQPSSPRARGQFAQVQSQQPPISARDEALIDYAKKVASALRSYDKRWCVTVELVPSKYVAVHSKHGGKGPTLRLATITRPAEDQAAVIHETAVGRLQSLQDIRAFQKRRADARERKNAQQRTKRATNSEWSAQERQRRRKRNTCRKVEADPIR